MIALLAEGAVRVRQSLRHGGAIRIESLYHVDPESGLRVPVAGFTSEKININSLGFRGPEIMAKKPAGTVRIAFLGASTTFSAEVSNDQATWPHLVIEKLREVYPERRFDYVNGGVPGYTLESSLKNLQERVAPLAPDIIVIYHATNDLSGNSAELARKRGFNSPRGDVALSWLAEYSMLWYLVEKNLVILKRQAKAHSADNKLNVDSSLLSEPFEARLGELVAAAKGLASETVLVTFSIRLRQEQSPEEKKESAVTNLYYMPYFTPDDLLRHFSAYNAVIRRVATESGVMLIGGESDIPDDNRHFVDSVHFSDLGSEMMARRVFDGFVSADLF